MAVDRVRSDPTGSVERLRRDVEALLAGYDAATRRIDEVQREMRGLTGAAQAADRMVRVTVGARGQLTGLEIDQGAYRKLAPARLAATILELTEQAVADLTGRLQALLGPLLPPGTSVQRILSGAAEPAEANPILAADPSTVDAWWAAVTGPPGGAA